MAADFPTSPTLNQTYTFGGRTWKWNGTGWALVTNSIDSLTVTGDITMTGTGAIKVASGTTAQRPTGANGLVRYNSDLGCVETYVQGAWQTVANTNIDYGLITTATDTTFDYGALV